MQKSVSSSYLDEINWNNEGLVPVIAQDKESGKVLALTWMNQETLGLTVAEGRAVYWSRSRQKIWRKGELSGHIQIINDIRLDCDKDAILLIVTQQGGIACHTGRQNCFYNKLEGGKWQVVEPVIKDPGEIYNR